MSGDLPIQLHYFQLWEAENLIDYNCEHKILEYLPQYFGTGTNGGGEPIAINLQTIQILAIPFVPMEESVPILVANSFEELEQLMGFTGLDK